MTSSDSPSAVPLVAVVTRTKDRPIMLERAIASVLGQTCGDWVHVIVNDVGDPAPVDALVARHAEAYAGRVRVVHRTSSTGMESASNAGIAAAPSRYIVIHDDDDTWHPEFLAATTAFLAADPAWRGVVTHSRIVNERIEDDRIVRIEDVSFNSHLTGVTLAQMAARNQWSPISFLFERAALEEIGGFREDLPVLGDWEFNLRFLARFDIGILPRELAYYHHRVADLTSIYANTVIGGAAKHHAYEARVRNRLMREDMAAGEVGLGVLANLAGAVQTELQTRETRKVLEARLRDAVDSSYRYHAEVSGLMEERGRLLHDQEVARGTIADLQRQLADRDRLVVEAQRHAADREAAVEVLRGEVAALHAEMAALKAEREAILGSTSWRLTAPVRKVLGRLTGRRA